MTGEKLQKVLANSGLGSRRKVEGYIEEGRIRVDGTLAHVGQRIGLEARIEFDGKPVSLSPILSPRILLYHKPLGEISTRSDPAGRPTVFDNLPPVQGRWISIGRLDINTSGLLLFTNNGTIADWMMHPSSLLVREYMVRLHGNPTRDQIESLKQGVELDGQIARFSTVERLQRKGRSNQWYRVTVKEGRYREVRRLWEKVGCRVNKLKRMRFGRFVLPTNLEPGRWQNAGSALVREIRSELNI